MNTSKTDCIEAGEVNYTVDSFTDGVMHIEMSDHAISTGGVISLLRRMSIV